MKALSATEVSKHLSLVHSLKPSIKFYDVHVHPYEVLFDQFSYSFNLDQMNILSVDSNRYRAPRISDLKLGNGLGESVMPLKNLLKRSLNVQKISLLRLRHLYGHVGEQVFSDQMDLCGIDAALLLPIASTSGEFGTRMEWVKKHYQDKRRFRIAGSVPNTVEIATLKCYVSTMKKEFGIQALKCHPVVTGIDLRSTCGKERLEAMLDACRENGLPLIVHSGKNMTYWGAERGNWASLEYLQDINWSNSGEPVVIAHAGIHRCGIDEVERDLLPVLKKLMRLHTNMFVDTSSIGYQSLCKVLREVDHDRLLFGSDALYDLQWGAVVMLLQALEESGAIVEDSFVRIASVNPSRTMFREGAN